LQDFDTRPNSFASAGHHGDALVANWARLCRSRQFRKCAARKL